jgi:DNA polymerase III epsilon subunit-like protein
MKKRDIYVVFDLETTGLERNNDQIIQISGIQYDLANDEIVKTMNYQICPDGDFTISIQAYLKHKITPEMLRDKPHLSELADDILDFFGNFPVITYNGSVFDIPFLVYSFNRIGRYIDFINRKCFDAYAEEKRRFGMHLNDVFKRYTGKTMQEAGYEAHDALGDSKATLDIFKAQLKESKKNNEEYKPENMITEDNVIINKIFQDKEMPCFNIGKYKDLPISYIASIDPGYLNWCINKAGFVDTTKNYIKSYLK